MATQGSEGATIHSRLVKVMGDVQAVGKTDRNASQGFSFRGIDAVLNAVGPALRKHGVFVLPEVMQYETEVVEVGKNRTAMSHVALTVRYRFVGQAGDEVSAIVAAEAMDSGDKATAKAMSVALRTALLQVLALPTDEPDPDSETYVRSRPESMMTDAQFRGMMETVNGVDDAHNLLEVHALLSAGRDSMTPEQRAELGAAYKAAKLRVEA